MKHTRGFTLIELMIVVAIIAILAAIAISQYQDYVIRTQIAEGANLAAGMKTSIGEFFDDSGYFVAGTGTNASYGLSAPTSIRGAYVSQVSVDDGIIKATFSSTAPQDAHTGIDGQFLTFSPISRGGSITWTCNRSNLIKAQWVPSVCRNN